MSPKGELVAPVWLCFASRSDSERSFAVRPSGRKSASHAMLIATLYWNRQEQVWPIKSVVELDELICARRVKLQLLLCKQKDRRTEEGRKREAAGKSSLSSVGTWARRTATRGRFSSNRTGKIFLWRIWNLESRFYTSDGPREGPKCANHKAVKLSRLLFMHLLSPISVCPPNKLRLIDTQFTCVVAGDESGRKWEKESSESSV